MFKVRGKDRGLRGGADKEEDLNFQFSDLIPIGNASPPFPFILGAWPPSSLGTAV